MGRHKKVETTTATKTIEYAPRMTVAEAEMLGKYKLMGTLSQAEALEYFRLLNLE